MKKKTTKEDNSRENINIDTETNNCKQRQYAHTFEYLGEEDNRNKQWCANNNGDKAKHIHKHTLLASEMCKCLRVETWLGSTMLLVGIAIVWSTLWSHLVLVACSDVRQILNIIMSMWPLVLQQQTSQRRILFSVSHYYVRPSANKPSASTI